MHEQEVNAPRGTLFLVRNGSWFVTSAPAHSVTRAATAAYLSAAAGEDDPGAFLQALRNVTEAMGGISRIATRTGLNRQQLYRTRSREGNPELRSLTKILNASGLQFVVAPKPASMVRAARKQHSKAESMKSAALRRRTEITVG